MIQSVAQYGDLTAVLTTDARYAPDIADDLVRRCGDMLIRANDLLTEAPEPEIPVWHNAYPPADAES